MIRPATAADIPAMLALGEAMHAESRYSALAWCTPKVCGLLDMLLESDKGLVLVAERDGVVVGGFLGFIDEHFFSRETVATDLALFIEPSRRGGVAAARLLKAYVVWATEQGAAQITVGITTGVHVEQTARLFQGCGFAPVGQMFEYAGE